MKLSVVIIISGVFAVNLLSISAVDDNNLVIQKIKVFQM